MLRRPAKLDRHSLSYSRLTRKFLLEPRQPRKRRRNTMDGKSKVVVVGLGEVGQPLYMLISEHHEAVGVDVSPQTVRIDRVDVLHICYPFEIRDFAGESARYIELFRPA